MPPGLIGLVVLPKMVKLWSFFPRFWTTNFR